MHTHFIPRAIGEVNVNFDLSRGLEILLHANVKES